MTLLAVNPFLVEGASAYKAEGSPGTQSPKSYGSATDKIVCGDHLCSATENGSEPANIGKAK